MQLTGYWAAKDAQVLMTRLQLLDIHAHTRQARIVCLMSEPDVRLGGFPKRAIVGEPRVQGPWKGIFEAAIADLCEPVVGIAGPEFVILINAGIWSSSSTEDRERLIFHELLHLRQKTDQFGVPRLHDDGRPQLQVVPHDHEVFNLEVERYGVELTGLAPLIQAINKSATRASRRRAG